MVFKYLSPPCPHLIHKKCSFKSWLKIYDTYSGKIGTVTVRWGEMRRNAITNTDFTADRMKRMNIIYRYVGRSSRRVAGGSSVSCPSQAHPRGTAPSETHEIITIPKLEVKRVNFRFSWEWCIDRFYRLEAVSKSACLLQASQKHHVYASKLL